MSSSSGASAAVDVSKVELEMRDNLDGQIPLLDENKDIFDDNHDGEETIANTTDDTKTVNKKKGHDFSNWHREDLLYAVAKSRRYIHNVNSYDEDSIRSIVETLYEGLPMPQRSPTFQSLDEFIIEGITTTIKLHKKLLNHKKFIESKFNVTWLDNEKIV